MTQHETDNAALEAERRRRLSGRNWAVFAALMAFIVLVFVITIIKIGMHT